jgi:hypothetical protein
MTVHIIRHHKIVGTAKGDSQDDLMRWAAAAAEKAGLKHCTFKFVRDLNEDKSGKITREVRW